MPNYELGFLLVTRIPHTSLLCVALAALSACGGSTENTGSGHAGSAGQSGSAGSAGSGTGGTGAQGGSAQGGAGGTVLAGGAGGAGGTVITGGAGGSAGATCTRTEDRASISIARPGAALLDCANAPSAFDAGSPVSPTLLSGALVRVDAGGFDLDTCPPNADCAPSITRFEVEAPGLALELPAGAFVQVSYLISVFYQCQQSLEVSTIPTWGGMDNPAGPSGVLLLGIADGGYTFDDSPYGVERVRLDCTSPTPGCGSVPPGEYALELAPTAAPDRVTQLVMGETASIDLLQTKVPGGWLARNLRSYQTDYCDDYWNFAWWVRWQAPVK